VNLKSCKSYQPKSPEPEPTYAEEPKAVGFLEAPTVKVFSPDPESESQQKLTHRLEESEESVKDINRQVKIINKINENPTKSPVYDSNYESTQDVSKEFSDGSDIIIESPKQSWPTKLQQKSGISQKKNLVFDEKFEKQKSPPDIFMPKTPTRESSGSSPEMTFTVNNQRIRSGENAPFESRLSKKRDFPASYQDSSSSNRKSRSRFSDKNKPRPPSMEALEKKRASPTNRKSRSRYENLSKKSDTSPQRSKSTVRTHARSPSPKYRKSRSRFDNRRSKKRDHSPSPEYSVKKKRSPSPRFKSASRKSRSREYNSQRSTHSERKSRRRDHHSSTQSRVKFLKNHQVLLETHLPTSRSV